MSMLTKNVMVAGLSIFFVYGTAGALAAQIEDPPVATASAILGKQIQGSNYQIVLRPSLGFRYTQA